MALNGYAQYQQNRLLTASPAKLLLMAYDGAIKFCRTAGEKMDEQNFNEQNIYINKAVAIVCELASTLREEVDPLLASRLKQLYVYILGRLGHANINQDKNALNEAVRILMELRETWAEAERKIQTEAHGEAAA